ncbi:hypothetical protein ASC63_14270 [Leifsonia sp. Root112D2]|jgi:hypothetical protein|nr:hypothetical protein ASC63_14270 [Leifsonia sp. Root112D2]
MSIQVESPQPRFQGLTRSIELRKISDTEWRVSDSRIPVGDAGSVLGFVEKTDERIYEVLQLGAGHGIAKLTFRSLDEVTEHFARRS